jgi:hypothetical protein
MHRVLAGAVCASLLMLLPSAGVAAASAPGKPRGATARWLAEQIGPLTPPRKARNAGASAAQAVDGPPDQDDATVPAARGTRPLDLVRSFDIPTDDPSYARLLNLSFTYDSALAAAGFVAANARPQAEQVLDQLKDLRNKDGSIAYAFDVYNGARDSARRSGTIAWLGLAATSYEARYKNSRYKAVADEAAKYLLSLRDEHGLVRGGPDVTWVSTQHNLLTYELLRALGRPEADALGNAIDANLMGDDGRLHFKQGLDDPRIPLDVQGLGMVYLEQRGRHDDAERISINTALRFSVRDASIALSKDPATYNMTYEAKGPFTGYKPYGDTDGPDLIWMEGTLESVVAMDYANLPLRTLFDSSIKSWNTVAGTGVGPLMANRTVTDSFNEYHVWPVSATASWTLLRGNSRYLFG